MRESMYRCTGKTWWSVWAVIVAISGQIILFGPNGMAADQADQVREEYTSQELRLLSPGHRWHGLTYGLGPDPAERKTKGEFPRTGTEVQALSYDAQTDILELRVVQTSKDGVVVDRAVKLKPWEPFTISNGSCAGYLFWFREKNVRPAGYAVLQFWGFCP